MIFEAFEGFCKMGAHTKFCERMGGLIFEGAYIREGFIHETLHSTLLLLEFSHGEVLSTQFLLDKTFQTSRIVGSSPPLKKLIFES